MLVTLMGQARLKAREQGSQPDLEWEPVVRAEEVPVPAALAREPKEPADRQEPCKERYTLRNGRFLY